MRLALAAPVSEIDGAKEDLNLQIFIAFLVISCLAILMTVLMTRRLIRPLKDLNDAAKKIAGGDEFVAILEGIELEHYSECLEDFEKRIKDFNKRARVETNVSIARGIAIFNYESDLVFNNVFKRADDAMYQNKIATKRINKEGK